MATETGQSDSPEVVAPIKTGDPKTDALMAHDSLLDKMKKHFATAKRQTVKIRNDGDVFVQVNGYSFLIKPNVKVEVPTEIATLLDEAGYI
jgi:hypothetical protein